MVASLGETNFLSSRTGHLVGNRLLLATSEQLVMSWDLVETTKVAAVMPGRPIVV